MQQHISLISILITLAWQSAQADPTPTPTVVYQVNGGYITQAEARKMQHFIRQLQDTVLSGDPNPQPNINVNLAGEKLAKDTVYGLIEAGVFIEQRSTCGLIKDAFIDRLGQLLKPQHRAEAAISCGCAMMEVGHGLIEAQLAANNVFQREASCAGL